MERAVLLAAAGLLACAVADDGYAQRRGTEGEAGGEKAKVIFRQDFEKNGIPDFAATGWGSVEFLKATMPESVEKSKVEGFAVRWKEGGALGSKGALEIIRTGDNVHACAEKYLDWPGDGATVIFNYYSHGTVGEEGLYLQGWDKKAGKNLHAYLDPQAPQDQWQVAKIGAESLTGFGGGAFGTGDTFGNIMFVEHFDEGVKDAFVLVDNLVIFQGRDGQPPTKAPSGLAAKWDAAKGCVVLSWNPAEDDVGIYSYEVFRADAAGVEAKSKNKIGAVCALSFDDRTTTGGQTYYYKIVGKDAGGNKAASEELTYKAEQTPAAATAKPKEKTEF